MTIFFGIGITITTLYGILSALAGLIQLKVKKIPLFTALGMTVLGILITVSPYIIAVSSYLLILLITILLLMHIISIVNGYYLYGKINISHHIFRLIISILIIVFLIL